VLPRLKKPELLQGRQLPKQLKVKLILVLKYLIAGLGNIGNEYHETRHNIGFTILDTLTGVSNIAFQDKRYGFVSEYRFKGRTFVLLKPSTYMNRSGLAIDYWLKNLKVPLENLLVLVDDLALPFGTVRIRPKGGDGGHNGLSNIIQVLGTSDFARVRFGIGDNFHTGHQVNYVLSKWSDEERKLLPDKIETCIEIIKSYGTIGLELTMTKFNSK
jgi:PTH1 family peptidyl-tRNA hydrolase